MTGYSMTFKKVSPEKLFMGSVLLFNGSIYLYNLLQGKLLGPDLFTDVIFFLILGIITSFLFGFTPSKWNYLNPRRKQLFKFVTVLICYELLHSLIRHGDIIVVQDLFNPEKADLYTSLALVGRGVYIASWLFSMILLPIVVQKQRAGKPTAPLLSKFMAYMSITLFSLVLVSYLYPEVIISSIFGDAYISLANLLWQYVLVSSLFAIANLIAYYFLSLGYYLPAVFTSFLGIIKTFLIIHFHNSLTMIVQIQLITMTALLVALLLYFLQKNSIR